MKRSVAMASLFALSLASASLAVADTMVGSVPQPNPWAAPGPDPIFDFTFNIGPDTGYGSLSATDQGGGVFIATAGTLTVTSIWDFGTYSLYTDPSAPSEISSPSGFFLFDDLLLPSQNPLITNGGLLFTKGGFEINIFSNGADAYQFYDNTGYNNVGTVFTLTDPVPEPSALVLFSIGFTGLWFIRRKLCTLARGAAPIPGHP